MIRAFYEALLSETFEQHVSDGHRVQKQAFIDSELTAARLESRKQFFTVRNFSLVEHRPGHVLTRYQLTEGTTGDRETRATERWYRDVYEVVDGKWRLASIEATEPQAGGT